MTNEVQVIEKQTPMTLIAQAVDRGMDPSQLEKLMDLQERWERNESAKAFNEAMAEFQAKCPIVKKSRSADFGGKHAYDFASLDDIMRAISPVLRECGLVVNYSTTMGDKAITADCRVSLGIHSQTSSVTLPIPSDMRVNDTQKMGAALSYAKRYALCAALNIVVSDEDSDAKNLSTTITEEQAIKLSDIICELAEDVLREYWNWAGITPEKNNTLIQNLMKLPASEWKRVYTGSVDAYCKKGKK